MSSIVPAGPSPAASAGPTPVASAGPTVAASAGPSPVASVKNSRLTIAVASRLGSGIILRCKPTVTIKRLAALYSRLTKTPPSKVHLSYNNKFLMDEETLADIGMEPNKIIEVHDILGIAEYTSAEFIFCH